MKNLLRRWLSWPASCELCARWPARPVCTGCLERHGHAMLRCPSCALIMAPGLQRCVRCAEAEAGPLHRCMARVDYAYPWSALVARLKRDPAWATHLAELMIGIPGLPTLLDETDLIVPVPLTPDKLRERGYNQAWELVKALRGRYPGAPEALPDLLLRPRQARVQHELGRTQRFVNTAQAYTVAPRRLAQLRQRRLLLVDDVMTTGATLQAAASALLDAGALQVSSLVFARTPAPTDN